MAGTSGRFPAHAILAAAAAARPTEVACRLSNVASCKVRRSGEAKGGVGGSIVAARVARVPEYLGKPGRAGGRAAGQVARELPPSLKGGGSLALVLVLWPRSARAFLCSPSWCSCHLRPAGSPGLLDQPSGPPNRTKQPVNISLRGGSDPLSWSRLLFQVAHTVSAARSFFCLVRIASYHVCSRGNTPNIAPQAGLHLMSRWRYHYSMYSHGAG